MASKKSCPRVSKPYTPSTIPSHYAGHIKRGIFTRVRCQGSALRFYLGRPPNPNRNEGLLSDDGFKARLSLAHPTFARHTIDGQALRRQSRGKSTFWPFWRRTVERHWRASNTLENIMTSAKTFHFGFCDPSGKRGRIFENSGFSPRAPWHLSLLRTTGKKRDPIWRTKAWISLL